MDLKKYTVLISCIITAFIYCDYLNKMYIPKFKRKYKYLRSYLFMLFSIILVNMFDRIFIRIIGNFICCLGLHYIFYNEKKISYFLKDLVFVLCGMVIDIVTVPLFAVINGNTMQETVINPVQYLASGIVYWVVWICTYRMVIRYLKSKNFNKVKLFETFFLIIMAFIQSLIINYLVIVTDKVSSGVIIILIAVTFLALDIMLIYLLDIDSAYENAKQKLLLRTQQMKCTVNFYNELEEKYNQSRKIIHDIEKHIDILRELQKTEPQKSSEYSLLIEHKLRKLGYIYQCDNRILQVLVNHKIAICQERNIKFHIDIQNLDFAFMDQDDVTILFANLFDNAVDACEKIFDRERRIEFRMHQFQQNIVINIANTAEKEPMIQNGEFISSKPNHIGIGISNIKDIVLKYGGNINFEFIKGTFIIKVYIIAQSLDKPIEK